MQDAVLHRASETPAAIIAVRDEPGIQRPMLVSVCVDMMSEDQATGFPRPMPTAGKPRVRRGYETGQPWRSLRPVFYGQLCEATVV